MQPRSLTIPSIQLPRSRAAVSFASVAVLMLAFLPCPALADDEGLQQDDQGIFIETLDVNIVNVEVYVTDKKGNRISGLTQDDFLLEVDRKPVAITNFYAVEEGVARGDGLEALPEPAEPGRRLPEAPPVPEEQKLHLIVYIDNLNIRPFTRNKAFRFIRGFLRKRLTQGDKVMLVTFERSLKVRHPFTSDSEIVASALYEIETFSGHGVTFDSDRRDILDAIYDVDTTNLYSVAGRARTYAESLYNDMSFTLRSLEDMVENLAGLPGRKAILYVSDGISMRPGEDIFHALDDKFRDQNYSSINSSGSFLMEAQRFDMSRDFTKLTTKANANRVTFYTLDAAGLRTYSYMDVSNSTAQGGAFIDQVHFSNLQNSLVFMAQETGGKVILNTNDFTKGLDQVGDDFSSYYSLGFSSGNAESGRYHNIQVKLRDKNKSKKWRVRHREGYRDKPISTRMSEGTLAALHYGYQNNPLDVRIEVGQERPQEKGRRFLVPVSVQIPISSIAFLPQTEFHRGRIRLYVAARDEEGGLSPIQDVPVPIDIPVDQFERAQQQMYKYDLTLQMRTGRQVVAVGVHDEIGAVSGFVTRGVSIGPRRR